MAHTAPITGCLLAGLIFSACTANVLPRRGSVVSGQKAAVADQNTEIILEPVRLFPPRAVIGSANGIPWTGAQEYCLQHEFEESKLSTLALSGFSPLFSKIFEGATETEAGHGMKQKGLNARRVRIIPSVLEVNCAVESAEASVFVPLILYIHTKSSTPVTVKTQAIAVDDVTNRVLFVVESAGEYEETKSQQTGILLLLGWLNGEGGRPMEDAFRASFSALAQEVQNRLAGVSGGPS